MRDTGAKKPETVAAWVQVARTLLWRVGIALMVVIGGSATGGALEYSFVMHGDVYELRSTNADVRLRRWNEIEHRYEEIRVWPSRDDRALGAAHPVDAALSPSGPYLLVADAENEYSIWRLELTRGVAKAELRRFWSGRLDSVMNFSVAADDVVVVGGVEPAVLTGRQKCRLPDRLHSLNVAAKSDGTAIFYNGGTPMVVADIDSRTCRCRSVRTVGYAGWLIVDVKPAGRGWLAVMMTEDGESFVVLLDRRGRVTYRYEISGPSSDLPRYLLTRAENGFLIAGDSTPIFAYGGTFVRRLEAPRHGRAIEGSSLRVPIVAVADDVFRATLGKDVPGQAVRGLWLGPVTFIVESRTYVVIAAACGFVGIASLVAAVRALAARRNRRS